MLAQVLSGGIYGIDAFIVEVEVNAGRGDFKTIMVGLPDAAVKESTDRVCTALINSSFFLPQGRVTINLAPADIKKEGPVFDLPIALGMLVATEIIDPARLEKVCVVGELALSGELRKVRGVLPLAIHAKKQGCRAMIVPEPNAEEAAIVDGLEVFAVNNLRQAVDFLTGNFDILPFHLDRNRMFSEYSQYIVDFSDVKGQESAKRAIEVACSGGHNILAIGPPGTGKSMLAKRVVSIQPPMTFNEALETTKIHSIAGILPEHQALVATRPFRSPHHTVSDAGLLGGGTHPMPGEVSLAHHGILFLDELPEFARNVLEVLRQPLEDGQVTISRAAATATFPSRFMLVAAMNPCPCGYFSDPKRECRCTPKQIQNYLNRISGPLLDRIDIHIEVPAVNFEELTSLEPGEPSSAIRDRVISARSIQHNRFNDFPAIHSNAEMGNKQVARFCHLTKEAQGMLKMAINELNFSARAYDRIVKVSRTVADLSQCEEINEIHVSEAIGYRTLDRQLWM